MDIVIIASTPESIIPFRGKLIKKLHSHNVNVHICAPFTAEHRSIVKELRDNYCVSTHTTELDKASANIFSDFRYLVKLIKIIRKIKPDIVLCYTMKPVIYGSLAGWINRVPSRYSIITGLGFLFNDTVSVAKRGLQFIGKLLLSFSIRKNKRIFFQNNDDLILFKEKRILGKNQSTCVVNGSGVDLELYSKVPQPSEPSFLLIARMIKSKGIQEYVDAIREVKKSHPFVKFSLVGGVEKNIDAIDIAEINLWVLEGLIEYKGRLSDVRPEISKCSVYVLPSYREGTPRSVLEAMAMGRAIITTDVPGCRETVLDGVTGLLIPPKDPLTLATAMKKLIQDEGLRREMGDRSREYAERKYSDEAVAADVISYIELRPKNDCGTLKQF